MSKEKEKEKEKERRKRKEKRTEAGAVEAAWMAVNPDDEDRITRQQALDAVHFLGLNPTKKVTKDDRNRDTRTHTNAHSHTRTLTHTHTHTHAQDSRLFTSSMYGCFFEDYERFRKTAWK